MAMSVPSLKQRIIDRMKEQFGDPASEVYLAKFAQAMADAVYDEITINAVAVIQPGTIANNVTTGFATAPVTGTGTATVT